jgi:mannose/cellobiose epimerase-like protein (N-acyl-D-glucosamine 2-epimerase family)
MRVLVALVSLVLALLAGSQPARADRNAYRAAVSFRSMQHTFLDRGSGLYREDAGGRAAVARAWPYSQALAATLAMTRVPGRGRLYLREAQRRLAKLARYRRADGVYASAVGPAGAVYYDDNEWIALELLRWYDLRSAAKVLAAARRLFSLAVSAWDADPAHACPGGVFWTNARGNDDRNTVTTATGALLGLRLYELTGEPATLRWARRMLDWVTSCMLAPDGLLWDHVALDGTRDERHWSYNQGTMVGACVLLYRLTGDAQALLRAQAVANASLAYFELTPDGDDPPFFLAIFFRNLLALEGVDGDTRYRSAAQAYADGAWDRVRDVATGLFRFRSHRPTALLEQAAMVQIYAALAQPAAIRSGP